MSTCQSPNRKGKKSLSATNLAIHHHLQCDLYLYNTYNGSQHLDDHNDAAGAQFGSDVTSTITAAHLSRGNDWETKLLSWLDKKCLLVRVASSALEGDDLQALVDCTLDEREHFFISGLALKPPSKALQRNFQEHGNAHQSVQFGVAKPDLLEIKFEDGIVKWQVIDAKASDSVKVSSVFT